MVKNQPQWVEFAWAAAQRQAIQALLDAYGYTQPEQGNMLQLSALPSNAPVHVVALGGRQPQGSHQSAEDQRVCVLQVIRVPATLNMLA